MGTFAGVFTPSILTILGLILFMRLGYVVGSRGLYQALIIILLANSISVLTSISLAAIATNLKVKGGGVYYIISRTLGLPFGGAIGVVLFVAQSISVGFYCVGFAEGVTAIFGGESNMLMTGSVAAVAVVTLCVISWVGADLATRLQYVVMALLVCALIAFAGGAFDHLDARVFSNNLSPQEGAAGFWIAFAIFFPAVTGFTQGVNMSGDLKNAGVSIPRGTAAAVGLSFVIYILVAVLCAATIPRATLVDDFGAMKTVAAYAPLIDAGIIAATLSSALASFLGAPRILQSLARDRIFPALLPFAEGVGPDNNPRRGILLTGAIALAVVAIGNLNLIASIVSMFFVVAYGLLNYATYFEARAKSPSFRPTLAWYDTRISLVGWIGSMGVMLAIDLVAGILAVAIVSAIYQYLKRSAAAARWADGQRSYHLQIVRDHLLAANARIEHPRDWRPQILAFTNDPTRRSRLLTFANWVEGHSGLTTVVRILEGKGRHMRRAREEAEEALDKELRSKGLDAFPLVVSGPDLNTTVQMVIQSAGIGPLRVNTVLVNWVEQMSGADRAGILSRYSRNLHSAYMLGCNIVLLDSEEREWGKLADDEADEGSIDVWWQDDRTGQLNLVLAYLLTRNDFWRGTRIRVLTIVDAEDVQRMRARIDKSLMEFRIKAGVEVFSSGPDNVAVITEASRDASIVFVKFQLKQERFIDGFGNDLDALLPGLPVAVMTMAAEDIDLSADPDEGDASEQAAAADAIKDTRRKRDELIRVIAKTTAAIKKASAEIAAQAADKADAADDKAETADREKLQTRLRGLEEALATHENDLEQATKAYREAQENAAELGLPVDEKVEPVEEAVEKRLIDPV